MKSEGGPSADVFGSVAFTSGRLGQQCVAFPRRRFGDVSRLGSDGQGMIVTLAQATMSSAAA
jgi:hypothetical protein